MSYTHEQVADKLEITDTLCRYATALDTRDGELLNEVFVEDAVFEIGAGVGHYEGVTAIADVVTLFLGGLEASQHILTNFVIELEGDEASSSCYLHAQHYMPDQRTGGNTLEIGGTYHDKLVRTEAGWRIRERELKVTWTEGNHGIQVESLRRSEEAPNA
jgi:3-phenylpropionate/cinnamic acid dioxygenase small subunit